MLLTPSRASQLFPIHFLLTRLREFEGWGLYPLGPRLLRSLPLQTMVVLSGFSELVRSHTVALLRLIVKREALMKDVMSSRPEVGEKVVVRAWMKPRLQIERWPSRNAECGSSGCKIHTVWATLGEACIQWILSTEPEKSREVYSLFAPTLQY